MEMEVHETRTGYWATLDITHQTTAQIKSPTVAQRRKICVVTYLNVERYRQDTERMSCGFFVVKR